MRKSNLFPEYTVENIASRMSLRTPLVNSLKILEDFFKKIDVSKDIDLSEALHTIHSKYPTLTSFEHDFLSLTFAIATGVGKTRLMGAFVTYLYTQYNIKNFLIVAPGKTVYDKLKKDFSAPSYAKYVFNGIGCFSVNPPSVYFDDDYRYTGKLFSNDDIHIFIYNIDKFNKENVLMKKENEFLGDSFFGKLVSLPDLVVLMDESHHYRADKASKTINELKPLLGLELTATPITQSGKKEEKFKNVIYEYSLASAIRDGYVRTPFAITRANISFYNFGDEQLDRQMLHDGILNHEKVKRELELYSKDNNARLVKPFALVVCKDIAHAQEIEKYIKSDDFFNGKYKDKTITVHYKKEKDDEATGLLLNVENYENPVEIVIHVDKLKEGWDVNNLFTIIPLRTASSKRLREQMVGRGLRLPFGKRTGNKIIDSVYLTAHDKFQDIMNEAQKGDSLFTAENIIHAEELEEEGNKISQPTFNFPDIEIETKIKELEEKTGIQDANKLEDVVKKTSEEINKKIVETLQNEPEKKIDTSVIEQIANDTINSIQEEKDLGELFTQNIDPFSDWVKQEAEKIVVETQNKFIPIPQISVNDMGINDYRFVDFNLDVSNMNFQPIENDIIVQNLSDLSDKEIIHGEKIDFDAFNAKLKIAENLLQKSEIDYDICSDLVNKLIEQTCIYFTKKFGENGMKNIVMMNKKAISEEIFRQMMSDEHFYYSVGLFQESVKSVRTQNIPTSYNYASESNLFSDVPASKIKSTLITGIKRGVFATAKFDSTDEHKFARLLETETDFVKNWLRPNKQEFNLIYNRTHHYEPDFVVETEDCIYLVEVKGDDKLNDADVIAKKERAVKYCKVATNYNQANNGKPWKYVFIPSSTLNAATTVEMLFRTYVVEE